MLRIWGRADAPNVQKVLWACSELGLAYERIDKGGRFGADDPAYLALNPNGLVPTLEHDGFVLWESHAILRYLANLTGDPIYPSPVRDRAKVDQWLDWQGQHQGPAIRALAQATVAAKATPTADVVSQASGAAEALFRRIDAHLPAEGFVAGDAFTLADIVLGVGTQRWLGLPVTRPALPRLESWVARLRARPAFRATFGADART
jgi:glutathione S-transferase